MQKTKVRRAWAWLSRMQVQGSQKSNKLRVKIHKEKPANNQANGRSELLLMGTWDMTRPVVLI